MITWKNIPFCPEYQISSDGQVMSTKYQKTRILKPTKQKNGYLRIQMSNGKGKYPRYLVHRLVLTIFVGPCPAGHECCHLNGKKTDNRLENLKWGTKFENASHTILHGKQTRGKTHPMHQNPSLAARGEKQGSSKLTAQKVLEIRQFYRLKQYTQVQLAKMYCVSQTQISDILLRKLWRHLP